MQPLLYLEGVNIVVLGNLNPTIFHPTWFSANNLLRPQEAEGAEVEVIHRGVAIIRADWFQLSVTPDRFQIGTTQEPYFEPIRDLVTGIFSLLSHTPLRAIGINHEFRYRLASKAQWHALGDRLAPKTDWDLLYEPGMRSLVMEGKRNDAFDGHIQVKIEPTTKDENGVYIEVNDHYELRTSSNENATAEDLIKVLATQWTRSWHDSTKLSKRLIESAIKE